jgi:ribosomal protein S18 acetylase RimI-like enzyme
MGVGQDHTRGADVRSATTADCAGLSALLSELAAQEGLPGAADLGAGLGVWFEAVVIERAGALVGAAIYYPGFDLDTGTGGLHVEALVVHESWRNQGFGSALLAAVAAKARDRGGAWVAWYARAENPAARRFYARIGAREEAYLNLYLQDAAFEAMADRVTGSPVTRSHAWRS